MSLLKKTLIFIVVTLFAIQFISVEKTNPPVEDTLTLKAPTEVLSLLKKGCYDCHSYETKWPSYSDIAPLSFFIASHVNDGRKAMNFSIWNNIDKKIKVQRLKRAVVTINNGRMALPSYLSAHEESKLSKDEKLVLTNWFKSELKALGEDKK